MKKRILLLSPLAALVLLQLWRPDHPDQKEDPSLSFYEHVDTPQAIHDLLERSCADCHSMRTTWPWYARITPVGQWLVKHVDEGSRHFSLSRFGEYPARRQGKVFHEIAHEVETGHMPLGSYLWVHREAALEESESILLVNWAKAKAAEADSQGEPEGESESGPGR